MGFYGALIGSAIGGARGSWLGMIAGAFIGSWVEEKYVRPCLPRRFRRPEGGEARVPGADASPVSPIQREYDILGVSPSASDEEVKRAYHNLAKSFHPDMMKANGWPEDKIRTATSHMALINEAWSKVQKARGL